MKFLLTSLLVFYLSFGYSQRSENLFPPNTVSALVAENSKHIHRYENEDILKIYYRDSGKIVKAKGSLFIGNYSEVQLIPYGRKNTITISINDITAIGLWRRGDKIAAGIVGGILLTLLLLSDGASSKSFGLVIFAGVIGLYEVVAIPTFLLAEELSIRSEKKGYHFFIENKKLDKHIHIGHHFIRW